MKHWPNVIPFPKKDIPRFLWKWIHTIYTLCMSPKILYCFPYFHSIFGIRVRKSHSNLARICGNSNATCSPGWTKWILCEAASFWQSLMLTLLCRLVAQGSGVSAEKKRFAARKAWSYSIQALSHDITIGATEKRLQTWHARHWLKC